jgi:hypothetical protein
MRVEATMAIGEWPSCSKAALFKSYSNDVVIPSEARDLGFCRHKQHKDRKQEPRSGGSLRMTSYQDRRISPVRERP